MTRSVSRRAFQTTLAASTLAAATPLALPEAAKAGDEFVRDYPEPKFKPSFKKPQLPRLLVQDYVIYSHSDLEMVKKLVEKQPALINATMDWGGGDWETGLGAAGHMGRRDIAEFLLEKGARIDLFVAAMLGQLDTVKAILTAVPALITAKGPHGIPLLAHAKAGGKDAAPVLAYLETLSPKKKRLETLQPPAGANLQGASASPR